MTPLVEQMPLWLSIGFSLVGVVLSIHLARLAYAGILFPFTIILTAGIVVFGFAHLLELADPSQKLPATNLETVASAIFLAAAGSMIYGLRKILGDPEPRKKQKEKVKSIKG